LQVQVRLILCVHNSKSGLKMRIARLLLCAMLLFPLSVFAQTGVYATFNASDFDLPHVNWQYGPVVGIYHNALHVPFFRLGVDARASFIGSGSTKVYSGLAGLRAEVHPPILPLKPYAEALVGGGKVEFGQGVARTDKTAFEYEVLGGADLTILPRIDWRVAEFSYSGFSSLGQSFNPRTISTGIVLRLP
jgi:hypothetical protein